MRLGCNWPALFGLKHHVVTILEILEMWLIVSRHAGVIRDRVLQGPLELRCVLAGCLLVVLYWAWTCSSHWSFARWACSSFMRFLIHLRWFIEHIVIGLVCRCVIEESLCRCLVEAALIAQIVKARIVCMTSRKLLSLLWFLLLLRNSPALSWTTQLIVWLIEISLNYFHIVQVSSTNKSSSWRVLSRGKTIGSAGIG